jgi:hypothetical protein
MQKEIILIPVISFLVSIIFGYGSTTMSGHEALIYPFLEGIFLLAFGIALVILAGRKKNKQEMRSLLLSTMVAIVGGWTIFTFCF